MQNTNYFINNRWDLGLRDSTVRGDKSISFSGIGSHLHMSFSGFPLPYQICSFDFDLGCQMQTAF